MAAAGPPSDLGGRQRASAWMKLAATPVYRQVTVRNHRTVLRLLELFEERDASHL